MTTAPGQAPRAPGAHWAWRWTHRCVAVVLAAVVLALAGLGLLAWRLAEKPLDLPQLARRIEATVNARPDGPRLSIGQAAIAWEGFRGGTAAPLDIRLRAVRLSGAGTEIELPEAALTLSFRALLRGVVAPATIELRRPRLHATLTDGGIALGLGASAEAAPATETDPATLLAGLMLPASDRDAFAALRRIRISGGEAVLADPAAGLTWTLLEPRIDLRRAADGGLAGEGEAVLRAGAVSVPVRLSGEARGTPMRLSVGLLLPALRPAELATIWPPLAPLALLDAPVTLAGRAEFDADARPDRMQARLEAGPGALVLAPGQRLPLAGLVATVEGSSRALTVREASLRLPGRLGQPGPVLTAKGEVLQRDGAWQAGLDLTAGSLQAAELPFLWPAELAPEARALALRSLPAGLLEDARARLDLAVAPTLDAVVLESARLGLGLTRAVVDLGQGSRVAVATAELAASYTPGLLRLDRLLLRPQAAGPGSVPPSITAAGEARLRDARWLLQAGLRLDALAAAELDAYWPKGLAFNTRDWLVQNLTAGQIRNGRWQVTAEAPATLDRIAVTDLSGTIDMVDATVHWLRPVPPVLGVSGTAEFGPAEVILRGRGGRQALPDGRPGGIEVKEATVRFSGLDSDSEQAEITGLTTGPLPEIFALLRHPRLKLFEKRKLKAEAAGGQAEARLEVSFPLLADLPMDLLKIAARGRVTEARLPGALVERDVERGNLDFAVDTEGLKLNGHAVWAGAPVKLGLEMDFRNGGQSQVTERGTLGGRFTAAQVNALGVETGRVLDGHVGLDARYERRRNGQASVALRGDLRDARLGVEALRWAKPPGTPGSFEGTLRLQGETLGSMEAMRLETLDLALKGRGVFGPRGWLERFELAEGRLGLSRFGGEVRRPEHAGGPWQADLRGPVLDLRPVLGTPGQPPPPATAPDENGLPLQLDLRFDRMTMGEGRNVFATQARVRSDATGLLRELRATGRTGGTAGAEFDLTLAPQGQHRLLRLTAADGGALLQAMDLTDSIRGGRLSVSGNYDQLRAGAALAGTAELEQFVLRDAPALAKLLQAMTLYGLVEAIRGGSGLVFTRLVAPFVLTPEALTLTDARAFSASLGLTAKGQLLREKRIAAIEGTIVPAYVFNTLLGKLPILGRLFSPEAGGGVFAATYRVQGPLDDPQVSVNPLAALTPGFLRGLFGLGTPAQR
ncbi:AsmA-like C-terminal region-containing protein [Dankookia sp. GCM10030260]|uniref:YhdP family protein n=1 Tax=Dankookia sp. GCM10030260 TaxID=3273390 RepID=UPI003615269F